MKKLLPIVIAVVLVSLTAGLVYFLANRGRQEGRGAASKEGTQADASPSPVVTYTREQLAAHATPEDCWIGIEGRVYDVTSFISSHPGGEIILQGCGKDATAMFNNRPGEGEDHSQEAREQLKRLYKGELAS